MFASVLASSTVNERMCVNQADIYIVELTTVPVYSATLSASDVLVCTYAIWCMLFLKFMAYNKNNVLIHHSPADNIASLFSINTSRTSPFHKSFHDLLINYV